MGYIDLYLLPIQEARIEEYRVPLGHPGHFAIIQLREGDSIELFEGAR